MKSILISALEHHIGLQYRRKAELDCNTENMEKCPLGLCYKLLAVVWLMALYFFFFSDCNEVTSCNLVLECFNCSNSLTLAGTPFCFDPTFFIILGGIIKQKSGSDE